MNPTEPNQAVSVRVSFCICFCALVCVVGCDGVVAEGEGEGEVVSEGEGDIVVGEGEGEGDIGVFVEASDAACSNGNDDDLDSYVDCEDFDCDGFSFCGLPEASDAACSDGIDDDGDTYVDCVDFGCEGFAACGTAERDNAACSDGVDNDHDDLSDCADAGCVFVSVCRDSEDDDDACNDGVDNDGDTRVDCDDGGCALRAICQVTEEDDATCSDGVDNDGDTLRDCNDPQCDNTAVCTGATLRVVHWNVQQVFGGDPPSGQGEDGLDAAIRILTRLDGDVVCLNEVHDDEAAHLQELAFRSGYPFVFQGQVSTPMAGGLTNACLARRPFLEARSRSSDDISSDAHANETGRDLTEVRVELVPGVSAVTIISAHLKSGFAESDDLRKHIEAVRAADLVRAADVAHPADGVVVMGDMNYDIADGAGTTYTDFPAGMPSSYRLGSDLHFPFTIDPFGALVAAGLEAAHPRHEDSDDDATRIPSGRRIDYQLHKRLTLVASEVYDPCKDNGVDDGSPGGFIEFKDAPVACRFGELASDHWPVVSIYAP